MPAQLARNENENSIKIGNGGSDMDSDNDDHYLFKMQLIITWLNPCRKMIISYLLMTKTNLLSRHCQEMALRTASTIALTKLKMMSCCKFVFMNTQSSSDYYWFPTRKQRLCGEIIL
eukprot:14610841-Ditylum_brightwellii.AAC.1